MGWPGQVEPLSEFRHLQLVCPGTIRGQEIEASYLGILRGLATVYRALHDLLSQFLTEREPRPESMTPGCLSAGYHRAGFRCHTVFAPLAAQTNVGRSSASGRSKTDHPPPVLADTGVAPNRGRFAGSLSQTAGQSVGELSGQAAGLGEPMAPTWRGTRSRASTRPKCTVIWRATRRTC